MGLAKLLLTKGGVHAKGYIAGSIGVSQGISACRQRGNAMDVINPKASIGRIGKSR